MDLNLMPGFRENIIALFDQAPMALVYLSGPDMVITAANKKCLEIIGQGESVIDKPIREVLPELVSQKISSIFQQVYDTGKVYKHNEMRVDLMRNGELETSYYELIIAPVAIEDGTIAGISISSYDVTEQVLARQHLRASEQRFRNLIEHADMPTAVYLGENMKIYLANEAMIKTWGKGPGVIGMDLKDALPELLGQPFLHLLNAVYHSGITYKSKEDPVRLVMDGKEELFYFNFSYKALRDDRGNIYGILNMATNVTEMVLAKKTIEENQIALTESKERLVELADSMPQQVWATNSDGELDFINGIAREYFGSNPVEVPLASNSDLIHPDDAAVTKIRWNRSMSQKTGFETEFRLRKYDGSYRYFLARALPILDVNGNLVRWIGTNTDIDEFKKLEGLKDDFITVASHELKTPLTSLKAYTQVLESICSKEKDEMKVNLLSKMDDQINKFTVLINDLLDTSKIQAGRMKLNISRFDFNAMVSDTVGDIQSTLCTKKIRLEPCSPVHVSGDRERLSQVVANFLSNAVKYSPDQEEIIVRTRKQGNDVKLSVQDFGPGIPAESTPYVFQQFYRVPGQREHTFPGIGLGLFIGSEIIERHEGKIWVETNLDKGAIFCFTIPISDT